METNKTPPYLLTLPNELIYMIISYSYSLSRVNKYLEKLTKGKIKTLRITNSFERVQKGIENIKERHEIESLRTIFSVLREIRFAPNIESDDIVKIVKLLAEEGILITSLTIFDDNLTSDRKMTDENLKKIILRCSNLKSLDVHRCGYITGEFLKTAAEHCPSLEILDLSFTDIKAESIGNIAELPNLKSLNLSGTHARNKTLDPIFKKCPNLEGLNLEETYVTMKYLKDNLKKRRLTFLALSSMGSDLKDIVQDSLISLELVACHLTSQDLAITIAGCENLEVLTLTNCPNIQGEGFREILQNCRNLKSLDLIGCILLNNQDFQAIVLCSNLQSLVLACGKVTDQDLITLASLKNLRSLNLASCFEITDIDLAHFARSCSKLCYLIKPDTQEYSSKREIERFIETTIPQPNMNEVQAQENIIPEMMP